MEKAFLIKSSILPLCGAISAQPIPEVALTKCFDLYSSSIMKKLFAVGLSSALGIISASTASALSLGDFAFTSFNADEDGFSIVAFVLVPANSTLYLSDNNPSSPTSLASGEGALRWDTGPSPINPGTVIRFSAVNTTTPAVVVGSVTNVGATMGLSNTGEGVFIYEGSSGTVATKFLAGLETNGANVQISNAGMIAGAHAVAFLTEAGTGQNLEYGNYTGPRSGFSNFSQYRALINDSSNWEKFYDGAFATTVPDTTPFTVIPEPTSCSLLASVVGFFGLRRRRLV